MPITLDPTYFTSERIQHAWGTLGLLSNDYLNPLIFEDSNFESGSPGLISLVTDTFLQWRIHAMFGPQDQAQNEVVKALIIYCAARAGVPGPELARWSLWPVVNSKPLGPKLSRWWTEILAYGIGVPLSKDFSSPPCWTE